MTLRKQPLSALLVPGIVAAALASPAWAQKADTGSTQDPRTRQTEEQAEAGKADAPRKQASDPKQEPRRKADARAAEGQPDEPEEEDDR